MASLSQYGFEKYFSNDKYRDSERAIKYMQQAAESGNNFAIYNLSELYSGNQLPSKNHEMDAIKWGLPLAERGYPVTQLTLGMMVYDMYLSKPYRNKPISFKVYKTSAGPVYSFSNAIYPGMLLWFSARQGVTVSANIYELLLKLFHIDVEERYQIGMGLTKEQIEDVEINR